MLKSKQKDTTGSWSLSTKYPSQFLVLDIHIFKVMVLVHRHSLCRRNASVEVFYDQTPTGKVFGVMFLG